MASEKESIPCCGDWYWELLEEQHAHDVVVTESRKDGSDGKFDSADSSEPAG